MEISRVFDLLEYQSENYPKTDAVSAKINGKWVKYSTQAVIEQSNLVALGLLRLGIGKDDKVAIISESRPEWLFTDYGIQKTGAVSVPMYPTITAEDYRYILADAGVKVVFVSTKLIYDKVMKAIETISELSASNIYIFDEVENLQNWAKVKELGSKDDLQTLDKTKAKVTPEDLFTIIYTSGTTGMPKGVMLTHNNVVSNVKAAIAALILDYNTRAMSFLPLCHILERTATCAYMMNGYSIYFAENMEKIGENMKEVQPHIFVAVPRVLEKVYDKIMAKGYDLTGVARKLFFWAVNLAAEYDTQKSKGFFYNIQLSIANNLIFDKWREALGGNVKYIICGSAALNPRLSRIFWAACLPILEGYGMTETSPVITAGSPYKEDYCIGTTGRVVANVQVKIAEDGEILVKGPGVMKGYYNKPDQTAETFDADGWLKTGDIGEFVDGKYLKITDRKKEIFKTSGGKYVAPQRLENELKSLSLVEQAMIIGENQKYPAAFVVPNFDMMKSWCEQHNVPYTSDKEMVNNQQVINKIQEGVNEINERFAQYEQIKQFRILPDLWTIESGEVTPTLKLKRKNILAKHKAVHDEIFGLNEKKMK